MQSKKGRRHDQGFTIPEVIVAGVILTIICVGTIQTFTYATQINRGNNLRMQALSILQQEVEYYRSLKFIPGLEDPLQMGHRPAELYAGTHTRPQRTSADGRVFNITVTVTNLSPNVAEHLVRYKRITISATPAVAENDGWLQNLNTQVTVERVRSN